MKRLLISALLLAASDPHHATKADVDKMMTELSNWGRWARRAAKGAWDPAKIAGLHVSTVPWLKKRDVAMVGSDACLDVLPSLVDGVIQPVHQLLLIAMGTPILDNLDLEAAGAEAAKRGRPAFLLTASPLTVKGGTGSPLNPVAVF